MYLLYIINYSWQKLAVNITFYVVVRTWQKLAEVVTHCYEFTEYNEYYPTSTSCNNIVLHTSMNSVLPTLIVMSASRREPRAISFTLASTTSLLSSSKAASSAQPKMEMISPPNSTPVSCRRRISFSARIKYS